MKLAEETGTALNDGRTLMLGAQILLGFQLQAPFQTAFPLAGPGERTVHLAVLALLVILVGLLVAPSARHRIVEDGRATPGINRFVSRIFVVSLAPFSLALGLDLALAAHRLWGAAAAAATGAGGALLVAAAFYGPMLIARSSEDDTMPKVAEDTPLSAKIEFVLTEARVVLPGVQALLGFQLAIVLTTAFAELPSEVKTLHGIALGFVAVATVLLIAPAAYHRIVFDGGSDPAFQRIASRLVLAATVFLALGLGVDIHVVVFKVAGSTPFAAIAGLAALAVQLGLWHAWPWLARRRAGMIRRTGGAPGAPGPMTRSRGRAKLQQSSGQ